MSTLFNKTQHDRKAEDTLTTAPAFDGVKEPAFWQRWLRPAIIERMVVAVDAFLIVVCGLVSAASYHWYKAVQLGKIDVYAAASALVALNFVLLVTVQRGYHLKHTTDFPRQIRIALQTWIGVFAVLLAIGFTMKISEDFSRGATILFFWSGLLVVCVWKATASAMITRALRTGAFTSGRMVVIAEQGMATASAPLRELRQHGYRLAQLLEIQSAELSSPLLMSTVNSRLQELIHFARDNHIEHVFLLLNWSRQHAIDSILDTLKVLPVPVHLVPDAHVARFLRYPVVDVGGSWAAELHRAPLSKGERTAKRIFDLAGAAGALILFAPIMLVAAALIKCESSGPVLFRQTRNGFNGRAFKIYKFRSMRVTEDGSNVVQATKHDARVTSVGRWLRKTSIDELPQLLNVILGDMSLVGPRPHAAAHNIHYVQTIGNYAFRHHVKPGITGWAQVNGYRGETAKLGLMEKRVEFDLWYINNWSMILDISILIQTAVTSFRQSKAY